MSILSSCKYSVTRSHRRGKESGRRSWSPLWRHQCRSFFFVSNADDVKREICVYTPRWPIRRENKRRAWASCQIRKIAGAHAPGMPGTFSPPPGASDPGMHHGTCVTHVPWCMPGSLTSGFLWSRRRGKTFPAFPAHAQPAMLRVW